MNRPEPWTVNLRRSHADTERAHDKEGLTIIIVTHESGVANQTNKIIHIKDGVIERIEDNIDHNASPFGKNGFMK